MLGLLQALELSMMLFFFQVKKEMEVLEDYLDHQLKEMEDTVSDETKPSSQSESTPQDQAGQDSEGPMEGMPPPLHNSEEPLKGTSLPHSYTNLKNPRASLTSSSSSSRLFQSHKSSRLLTHNAFAQAKTISKLSRKKSVASLSLSATTASPSTSSTTSSSSSTVSSSSPPFPASSSSARLSGGTPHPLFTTHRERLTKRRGRKLPRTNIGSTGRDCKFIIVMCMLDDLEAC